MKKLTILDTFSGIGGFSYAAERLVGGFETTQFVEIDPYCQKILKKHWPHVPIHDDIKTFTAKPFSYDCVVGGFPCQDVSVAGQGRGITRETRSGLFYELIRIIRMVRPRYVLLENVAALLNNGMGIVLGELSEIGYDAEWKVISARERGACHKRERVWIIAYPNNDGRKRRWAETRNQNATGQNTQGERATNTKNFNRQSNDGFDNSKSRTDGDIQRPRNGGKTESTNTRRVCELSKEPDNDQRISKQDQNKKIDNRALVPQRQSRVQLAKHRELESNKTTLKDNSIRHRNDNSKKEGMDNQEPNATNSKHNGLSTTEGAGFNDKTDSDTQKGSEKIRQSEGSSKPRDSRTFQQVTESTDPMHKRSQGRRGESQLQKDSGKRQIIWRSQPHLLNPNWRGYISEPTVRRGNDGLSNRVDRLRALGNSIVPAVATIPLGRILDLEKNEY